MMRRSMLFLVTVIAVFMAMAGAAWAATPFTAGTSAVGSGGYPDLAVGSDGVGHVAWMTGGANVQVGYCRVAPGGESCDRTELFNFGTSTAAQGAGRAAIFAPVPGKVVIVATCWNCGSATVEVTHRWTSTDNGAGFTSTPVGENFAGNGSGTWIDAGDIFVGTNAGSVRAAGTGVYESGLGVPYATGGTFSFEPHVVRLTGTNTLIAAVNDLHTVKFGVYGGPVLTADAINTATHWSGERTLPGAEAVNTGTALNSGPNGVYLSYLSGPVTERKIGLRHFDPAAGSFGAPVYLQSDERPDSGDIGRPDSSQDAAGRIHMVWRSLYDGGRLRYRVSDSAGAAFGPVGNLATGEAFTAPRVDADPSGRGFAVWKGSADSVRVVTLDPRPEVEAGPAPRVGRAVIGDRTLRPGQGTRFTFVANTAGRALLTLEKRFKGLKVKRRVKSKSGRRQVRRVCLPRTPKRLRALRRKSANARVYRKALRRQSCNGYRAVGRIRQNVEPGRNTIRFNGRVSGRRLAPGSYRAKLVITDEAGRRSRAEVIKFKVAGNNRKAGGKRGTGRRR